MSLWIKDQSIRVIATKAEDKGKVGELRFVSSRKVRETGQYKKSYFSFWSVAGTAYQTLPSLIRAIENSETFANSTNKKGVQIVIKTFSIAQEKYNDKNSGEEVFSKQPRFTIWDWDFVEPADKSIDTPSSIVAETPFDDADVSTDWPEE